MVAAACAGSHRPIAYRPEPDPCVLVAPPQSPPESITVALPSAPRTTAEGFVVAQSYETLLGVQCRGRLHPQLARISSSEEVAHGRQWTITLPVPDSGIALRPRPADASSRVKVRSIDASAARDVLDAGVDLLVTDDPAIVSYAARNADLLSFQLPWDRTYVVLAPESAPPDINATIRLTLGDLLKDAVRADVRMAEPPFWWESNNQCTATVGTRPVVPAQPSSRVVYLSGDRVAQGVAERLVALAASRSVRGGDSVLVTLLPRLSRVRVGATAAALSPSAFAAALHAGDDLAYVLPLPRFAAAPCDEFAMLLRAAPWMRSVIPLIDTRSVAIVRRGRVGLAVDADGSLRLLDSAAGKNDNP